LHLAAANNHSNVVQVLISARGDVNKQNEVSGSFVIETIMGDIIFHLNLRLIHITRTEMN